MGEGGRGDLNFPRSGGKWEAIRKRLDIDASRG
jgi:hypothetical protein